MNWDSHIAAPPVVVPPPEAITLTRSAPAAWARRTAARSEFGSEGSSISPPSLRVDQVNVTLADARPELVFNQITAGSSTIFTIYTPVRIAAAIAQQRLLDAAALQLQQDAGLLTSRFGLIEATDGTAIPFSELAVAAASDVTSQVEVILKPEEDFTVIGTPQTKTDQLAMVTGRKQFVTDLQIPDALPTVICRAPTLNGIPNSVENIDEVRRMPGITDVEIVSTGVAVRAATFGQCIDGVRALRVAWNPGTVEGENDESVLEQVKRAELPLVVPAGPGETVDGEFTFYWNSGSPLETNSAIADVREDRAEIWSPAKNPIAAQGEVAKVIGMPIGAVTFHVPEGGGSFGRKLFHDAALEAAEISQKMGKPVRLMWSRADDSRVGRVHPLCTSRVRALVNGDTVLSYEQRHTSVSTEINPGVGEPITQAAFRVPVVGNLSLSVGTFELTQVTPYDFGPSNTRLLNEVDMRFNTQSTRNIYSPNMATARELMVDQIAAKVGKDPYEFRREFLKNDRMREVLNRAAEEGDWGKSMPEGTAQGIAFHTEYKAVAACLMEIDARPETVNRPISMGVTGPRVTKVTFAVDLGLTINPRGLEGQMLGCINDAIAMTLTSSLHLTEGYFVESSWDNYFYTRQWNTPPEINIIILDTGSQEPGGAGELGVAPAAAATACAYARAIGQVPTFFPINHFDPFPFEPTPTIPPISPSPTDGLQTTF